MTRGRGGRRGPRSMWGHATHCPACGGALIWATHIPTSIKAGVPRSKLPFDAEPTDDVTARYAISGFGQRTSRHLGNTPTISELDLLETRHFPHLATCPAGVTTDQLAAPPPPATTQAPARRQIGSRP